MSVPTYYTEVISGLLEKSKAKEVLWETAISPYEFIAYLKNMNFSCGQETETDTFNHTISILRVKVNLLSTTGPSIDEFVIEKDDWEAVRNVYDLAHVSALSIDKAIHETLVDMNKDEPIKEKNRTVIDDIADELLKGKKVSTVIPPPPPQTIKRTLETSQALR
ncbi:hypothetical protein PilKf_00756 [Pillotina sp. SPG140]